MTLSDISIREAGIITPFREEYKCNGFSGGLSICGYDVAIDQDVDVVPGHLTLASTVEHFTMPPDVVGVVHDKSSWARKGLAVQNTVLEPGWRGFLTLELTCHDAKYIKIEKGTPIAQILFHRLDRPPSRTYQGKYQDQERGPQEARTGEELALAATAVQRPPELAFPCPGMDGGTCAKHYLRHGDICQTCPNRSR